MTSSCRNASRHRTSVASCQGLGGGDVTRSTEVGFDGFALFTNSAVEVHPLTAYLEVGLIYAPGIADRPFVGLPTFLELWDVRPS
jgi:hypothetical protein